MTNCRTHCVCGYYTVFDMTEGTALRAAELHNLLGGKHKAIVTKRKWNRYEKRYEYFDVPALDKEIPAVQRSLQV